MGTAFTKELPIGQIANTINLWGNNSHPPAAVTRKPSQIEFNVLDIMCLGTI